MRELHPQPLVSSMLPPAYQKPAWISLTLQRYRIFRASKAGRRIPVASGMSRGPVPSQLHLLSNLPALSIGDKVRFLGCVISYSTSSACLSLAHLYPRDTNVTALVDVSLLLETLTSEQTRVGEYLNIIGYITAKKVLRDVKLSSREEVQVSVQAIALWSTGSMDLQKYERILDPPKSGG
ncbi:telomere capping, CST complex subunit-domain-containing protein [Fusarium solani]|uniref:Telomere capping, CST complex subunit-domain-containing protein n=1 Tax=Fusarium solani TaxID=169388 RepID=A0A9P9HZ65_FUSSL|nr:telomere capping, CST complex subunit-domain-containing protein [Fusarium solani]KAH7266372.1 telomere capping, CST complex subunit-domain-containing protein [Fusarium solani]